MSGDTGVISYKGRPYRTVKGRIGLAIDAGGYSMEGPPELLEINSRTYLRVHIVTSTGQHYYGTKEVKWGKGSGGSSDFDTPLEKAETGAIGRALGFAGYGDVDADESLDEQLPQAPDSSPHHRQPPPASNGEWKGPMATVWFRQRCNALGYRSVEQVQALVDRAGSPNREACLRTLEEEEQRAKVAGGVAGVTP